MVKYFLLFFIGLSFSFAKDMSELVSVNRLNFDTQEIEQKMKEAVDEGCEKVEILFKESLSKANRETLEQIFPKNEFHLSFISDNKVIVFWGEEAKSVKAARNAFLWFLIIVGVVFLLLIVATFLDS